MADLSCQLTSWRAWTRSASPNRDQAESRVIAMAELMVAFGQESLTFTFPLLADAVAKFDETLPAAPEVNRG